jgi:hypothetical protein
MESKAAKNQAFGKRRGEVREAEPDRAALLCGSKVPFKSRRKRLSFIK